VTAENILGVFFKACLYASLSIAFAQHLWQLFRIQDMKFSIIESIYVIRKNLLALASPPVFFNTPVLIGLAAVSWVVPMAVTYPPRAVTVQGFELQDVQVLAYQYPGLVQQPDFSQLFF
jgi:hypothetical protein